VVDICPHIIKGRKRRLCITSDAATSAAEAEASAAAAGATEECILITAGLLRKQSMGQAHIGIGGLQLMYPRQ